MSGIVDLFREISRGLAAEFTIVRQIPHRGESGRATEDALRALLKRHVPSRFDLVSGFAIGQGGTVSSQADILVIDALNCPRFLQTQATGLYPIEGVVSRIEVTQNLTARKRGEDLNKIREFRSIPSVFNYAEDFRDSAPLAFLFAETAESSLLAQAEWLADEWCKTAKAEKGSLPNGLVILDKGVVLYQNAEGGVHCDPFDARKVVALEDAETALLVWLIFMLHKSRILLEHRIRARAKQIFTIRSGDERSDLPFLSAMGAEPYFPDLIDYFSIKDYESLKKVVASLKIVELEDHH